MLQVEVDVTGWKRLLRTAVGLKDSVAWIKNIVPYVVWLEYGGSKQAPHGMARRSIPEIRMELVAQLRGVQYGQFASTGELQQAMNNAVDTAAGFGQMLIRSRTPIRTGWARLGWVIVKTDGQEVTGPPLGSGELKTITGRGEMGRAF